MLIGSFTAQVLMQHDSLVARNPIADDSVGTASALPAEGNSQSVRLRLAADWLRILRMLPGVSVVHFLQRGQWHYGHES